MIRGAKALAVASAIAVAVPVAGWIWARYATRNLGSGVAIAVRELLVTPIARSVNRMPVVVVDSEASSIRGGALTIQMAGDSGLESATIQLRVDGSLPDIASPWWEKTCLRPRGDTLFLTPLAAGSEKAANSTQVRMVAGNSGGGDLPLCADE
jgi:hypothetical protein